MPKPHKNEPKKDFIERCIPIVLHEETAQDGSQAAAICNSIWREHNKGADMNKLYNNINIEVKEADDSSRTITAIASKQIVDRDGDIVKLDGMNLKEYKKNPVILWSHNAFELPIGKAVGKMVWIEDDELKMKIQFASKEENPKADYVYKLFKGGFLKAFSVGFKPEFSTIQYKEDKGKQIRIINDSTLFEVSAVAVPANQSALIQSFEKAAEASVINKSELKELTDNINKQTTLDIADKKDIDIAVLKLRVAELELQVEEDGIYKGIFDEFRALADEDPADNDQTDTKEFTLEEVYNILNK
jgi:HK97 family phage prohead protease